MSKTQIISAGLLGFLTGLLAIRPDLEVAVAIVSVASLFAALTYMERKQDTEFDVLTAQVKDLRDKVQAILINKGLGR